METGREMATDWGVPEYRFLSIPHPIANLTESEMDDRAGAVVGAVVDLLQKGQTGEHEAEGVVAVPAR